MYTHPSQECPCVQVTACTPSKPSRHSDPIHEYRTLARELQEGAPTTAAQQLDKQVAWVMANYGGYSRVAITHAMREASVYLTHGGSDDDAYVERTVAAAMREDVWGETALGWGM